MKLCAIIPAAGRGSRLGGDRPKILVPLAPGYTIWDELRRKLAPVVDHIDVVLSPWGRPMFEAALAADPSGRDGLSLSIQPQPRGMGDAIFCAFQVWREAANILVIWGDQVHVSPQTLARCRDAHLAGGGPRVTLPVVPLDEPYVEYVFDAEDRLERVLQSREGDRCSRGGLGDVGVFLLSVPGLAEQWRDYVASVPAGAVTGELNFLPFLVFLSHKGWAVTRVTVEDPIEARGINTPEDLAFFRSLYGERR
jgi:bifunctional UDP-N-acetylglucosamine pyrophosphorylase / glucosamine-1-phosphate N-acetyltransferase